MRERRRTEKLLVEDDIHNLVDSEIEESSS